MNLKKNVIAHVPHSNLSSKVWEDEKMLPNFREALIKISKEFIDYLGIDIDVVDITMTGSYANYNYTPYSDIDLHIIVDFNSIDAGGDLAEQFFNAKKSFWNDRHDIELADIEVELYAQNSEEEHASSGVYSVLDDDWVVKPKRFKTEIDVDSITKKSERIKKELIMAISDARKNNNTTPVDNSIKKLKKMRKAGLEKSGELSDENIVYKVIRSTGILQKLFDTRDRINDINLSQL